MSNLAAPARIILTDGDVQIYFASNDVDNHFGLRHRGFRQKVASTDNENGIYPDVIDEYKLIWRTERDDYRKDQIRQLHNLFRAARKHRENPYAHKPIYLIYISHGTNDYRYAVVSDGYVGELSPWHYQATRFVNIDVFVKREAAMRLEYRPGRALEPQLGRSITNYGTNYIDIPAQAGDAYSFVDLDIVRGYSYGANSFEYEQDECILALTTHQAKSFYSVDNSGDFYADVILTDNAAPDGLRGVIDANNSLQFSWNLSAQFDDLSGGDYHIYLLCQAGAVIPIQAQFGRTWGGQHTSNWHGVGGSSEFDLYFAGSIHIPKALSTMQLPQIVFTRSNDTFHSLVVWGMFLVPVDGSVVHLRGTNKHHLYSSEKQVWSAGGGFSPNDEYLATPFASDGFLYCRPGVSHRLHFIWIKKENGRVVSDGGSVTLYIVQRVLAL